MKTVTIKNFQGYLALVADIKNSVDGIVLYRGQSENKPLLPSIARDNPANNTTDIEKVMLEDLRRRSQLLIKHHYSNDWEWLVLAQHFGLKTRLLDWSSNPLVSLWFACSNEYKIGIDSYVYLLEANEDLLVKLDENESPFATDKTKVLRPSLNNERIIAQSGWFTAHKYSAYHNKFVELGSMQSMEGKITEIKIPASEKQEILRKLSIFGVNSRTIYPDLVGLCSHLNWKYDNKIKGK